MPEHKLRELRKQAGITQSKLAKIVGLHQTMISQIENDERPIPDKRIADFAKALGVPESELRGEPVEEKKPKDPKPHIVRSRSAQGEWMAAVIQTEEDRDLAWVLAAIGSLADPDVWVSSVTMEQIEEQSGNPEVFHRVWDKVLKSPWLKRIGEGEYVFQLVFPVE